MEGMSMDSLIALVVAVASVLVGVVNSAFSYFTARQQAYEVEHIALRFEEFKAQLEEKSRMKQKFEGINDLMLQYKKPLLQTTLDLISRLTNQVKTGFLYHFTQRHTEKRAHEYAKYNMVYVIAEFLAWIEIIRQEIVFITPMQDDKSGNSEQLTAAALRDVFEAIKFQFTGETEVQGDDARRPLCNVERNNERFDKHGGALQLFAGELRAIGEVMLNMRPDDGQAGTALAPIGYMEFLRQLQAVAPEGDPVAADLFNKNEGKLQMAMSPLLDYMDQLSQLEPPSKEDVKNHGREGHFIWNGEAPTKRMIILQVLLCKLIDLLDAPMYEFEPVYILRTDRLVPLVRYLTPAQCHWLQQQKCFEDDPKLVFPGWVVNRTWTERCQLPDYWEGAFPDQGRPEKDHNTLPARPGRTPTFARPPAPDGFWAGLRCRKVQPVSSPRSPSRLNSTGRHSLPTRHAQGSNDM